ncbi:1,2-dihydroxy-3-keto-5-methylthiopentene dioxygenase 1 [Grifola frondosa]|uniref:acireductone dioxygenase (Fe(2+)-requiring) n=1 Tax=Grifola frondosa TaxID=5627 RepID=A0A1C7M8C0_GRIFR|nr:1,2-dihydroxy-3-keto-5-methylthiopentene dioxygenase 1 [Grifola frondosa]
MWRKEAAILTFVHTTDEWIRVHLVAGDMIILPAGIYHRFTLDSGDSARLLRLFKDEPKWAAHNRCAETDVNPHRLKYIKQFPGIAIGA